MIIGMRDKWSGIGRRKEGEGRSWKERKRGGGKEKR